MEYVRPSVLHEIENIPGGSEYNAALPKVELTGGQVKATFAAHEDDFRVLGRIEIEQLAVLADNGLTAFEIALLLARPSMVRPSLEDGQKLITDLCISTELDITGALKRAIEIGHTRMERGLSEARRLFEELVPDPVIAEPGNQLFEVFFKALVDDPET